LEETTAIDIRLIEPEDYEAVADLARANLGEYDSYDYDEDFADLEPKRIPDVFGEPKGQFWVAIAEDAVVGTLGMQRVDDRVCRFRRLAVHSDFRRHDVLQQLLERAEQYARESGFRRALAETTARQKPSEVFWLTAGYEEYKRSLRGKNTVVYFEKNL
jgi:GNAT superfamily N-acetyltransferase